MSPVSPFVKSLVTAFEADTTQPPAWESWVFCESFSREFVDGARAFEHVAKMFDAAKDCATNPVVKSLCWRWAFNARRRVPDAVEAEVFKEGSVLTDFATALPESVHRSFILATTSYDLSVLSRDASRFSDERTYAEASANAYATIAGCEQSAAISRFLTFTAAVNVALSSNEGVKGALADLSHAYPLAMSALEGHGWQPNLPIHVENASIWAGGYLFPGHEAVERRILENPKTLAHWRQIVIGVQAVRRGDVSVAHEELKRAEEISRTNRQGDAVCTALLVRARLFASTGDRSAAHDCYRALSEWTGLKGHVPKIVGAREAAELG